MSRVASCEWRVASGEKRRDNISRITFHASRFIPLVSVYFALVLILGLTAPGLALAQQGQRTMKLNQVGNAAWPDATLNLTLVGPDGKAVPDALPDQLQ